MQIMTSNILTTELSTIRKWVERQKGRKQEVEDSITDTNRLIRINNRSLRFHEKARELIREAGLKTQEALSYHISEITTLALDAIFDDPYELGVEFVERRNKTECDLFFYRNNLRIKPMLASGGGSIDVACFALRVASWSMQNPRSRNVIMLDEPLKYLSKEYQEKGSMMLKEVSDKLGIQLIVITHNETLASFADKTFNTGIKQGKTILK